MSKKKRIIISVVISVVALSLVGTAVGVILTREEKLPHVVAQGLDLHLMRDKLTYNELKNGWFLPTTDNVPKDFSKPSGENVFGLTQDSSVIPGCMYEAKMTVSSQTDADFVYWLEVKFVGDELISKMLTLTLTTDDGNTVTLKLSDGFLVGSEQQPIAKVLAGGSSTFVVKMELADNFGDNAAQGAQVSFDLIVHAAKCED